MKRSQLILPCLRAVIGDWVYYSSVMTAEQISDWVMPVKDIRESKVLDDYLQRELKEEKMQRISEYLLTDKQHFFNSIIIGIFGEVPDWIGLNYLTKEYKGREFFSPEQISYVSESSGIMLFGGNEQMFALDGQHRVEGIKAALGKVDRDKDSTAFATDQFSVILVGHIDDAKGRKRSRKLFSDINKNAKQVGRVDKIKIDEEDINAIVSRRIFAQYKYFQGTSLIALSETSSLETDDVIHFANLATLDTVCRKLKKIFRKTKGLHEWEDVNVDRFYSIVEGFYDFIIEVIPEYRAFFIDKSLTLEKARDKNRYFLFRPIGIKLLAILYANFYKDLGFLKENLGKLNFVMPESPLHKIVWYKDKMLANTANQTLAYELIVYMLGRYPEEKLEALKAKFVSITKQDGAELPPKILN